MTPKMTPLDKHRIGKFQIFKFMGCCLAVFGLLAAVTAPFGAAELQGRVDAANEWQETTGEVLEARVEVRKTQNQVMIRGRVREFESEDYLANVRVRYEIDGAEYTTDNIHVIGKQAFSKRAEAQGLVSVFMVGETVPVYYDPADPSQAALLKGSNMEFNQVTMMAAGLGMGGFGIAIAVLFSALIKMIKSKYELPTLDQPAPQSPASPEKAAEMYAGLDSAKYMVNRS